MSVTFEIAADLQTIVETIPYLEVRMSLFLRHEASMEPLRRERHSTAARGIAARAVLQAQQDQASGFDWDASFAELKQQHQAITEKL